MHEVAFNRIELRPDRPLIGMRASMSVAQDATGSLWRRFMPRRHELVDAVGEVVYSVQHFKSLEVFENFSPQTVFEKWAAVEVREGAAVPADMESFLLRSGHYAVFDHRGPPGEFPKTLQFIFGRWLPASAWRLDDREHFEVLPPGWRADDPLAREQVWIPVRQAAE